VTPSKDPISASGGLSSTTSTRPLRTMNKLSAISPSRRIQSPARTDRDRQPALSKHCSWNAEANNGPAVVIHREPRLTDVFEAQAVLAGG
jgi:hypothetical protein